MLWNKSGGAYWSELNITRHWTVEKALRASVNGKSSGRLIMFEGRGKWIKRAPASRKGITEGTFTGLIEHGSTSEEGYFPLDFTQQD